MTKASCNTHDHTKLGDKQEWIERLELYKLNLNCVITGSSFYVRPTLRAGIGLKEETSPPPTSPFYVLFVYNRFAVIMQPLMANTHD